MLSITRGLIPCLMFRELLVIVSQCTLLYNYIRIPLEVWKHVTMDDVNVSNGIMLNSLPESFLQDKEILQNFVLRYYVLQGVGVFFIVVFY